jgi:hypothetical protein
MELPDSTSTALKFFWELLLAVQVRSMGPGLSVIHDKHKIPPNNEHFWCRTTLSLLEVRKEPASSRGTLEVVIVDACHNLRC